MPGYALSAIFRAQMRDAFARDGLDGEVDPRVWKRSWTVHLQPIGRGEDAAHYLSRYVYHVALTNHRLERFADGRVTFRYTHAHTHETRRVTLPVHTFMARFLQHVLPRCSRVSPSGDVQRAVAQPRCIRSRLNLDGISPYAVRSIQTTVLTNTVAPLAPPLLCAAHRAPE